MKRGLRRLAFPKQLQIVVRVQFFCAISNRSTGELVLEAAQAVRLHQKNLLAESTSCVYSLPVGLGLHESSPRRFDGLGTLAYYNIIHSGAIMKLR